MVQLLIRPAKPEDAAVIARIYAPMVEETVVSFEEVAPSVAEMRKRIETLLPNYPYFVAERGAN